MAQEVRNSGLSACNTALSNWVVFSRILAWISDCGQHHECSSHYLKTYMEREPRCQSQEVLRRCCLVSRSWFYQAAPCLWRDLDCPGVPYRVMVTDILSAIPDPGRRQYYAKSVHSCTDCTRDKDVIREDDDIKLPNLKALNLVLKGGHVPNLHGPSLRSLVIDPESEFCSPCEYGLAQEEMKTICLALPIRFPNLESIVFVDRIRAYHGALENLATQLPRLKHFDHKLVYVTKRHIIHRWPSDTLDAENGVSSLEDDDSDPYDGGFDSEEDYSISPAIDYGNAN